MYLWLVIFFSDVSDTILYLLLGTTEPAEIENAEVLSSIPKSVIFFFCVNVTGGKTKISG